MFIIGYNRISINGKILAAPRFNLIIFKLTRTGEADGSTNVLDHVHGKLDTFSRYERSGASESKRESESERVRARERESESERERERMERERE